MWSSERRALLAASASAAIAWLAGCGFQLRQPPRLSFASIALVGFARRSPMAEELRQRIGRQVPVLDDPGKAEVILRALEDVREKSVVGSTSTAQVREVQLRLRLTFRADTPGGRELIPRSELQVARDLSYSEASALAKESEEAELYREMQGDVVAQALRRLASVQV
jgi:LPS-assembly lipoprotein